MKLAIFLLFIYVPLIVNCQSFGLNPDTNQLTYEEIINLSGWKADSIFNKVKYWMVTSFKNTQEVIAGENRPSLIKGTYIQSYFNGVGGEMDYYNTITIKIKDEALKVNITDIKSLSGYTAEGVTLKKDGTQKTGDVYQKIYKDIETKCINLVDNLKKNFTKTDDW